MLALHATPLTDCTWGGLTKQCLPSGWWFRPEFIINELNINSVITTPCHNDTLTLSELEYTVRGYAYTGDAMASPLVPSALCFDHHDAIAVQAASWQRITAPASSQSCTSNLLLGVAIEP